MSKTERRKAETELQAVLALADLAAVVVSVLLAYGIRFHSPLTWLVPATKGVPPLTLYGLAGFLIGPVWVALFAVLGLYRVRHRLEFPTQFDLALRGVTLGTLLALALSFFYRGATFSRLAVPMAGGLALFLVPAFRVWLGRLATARRPPARVAVVGSGTRARELARRLATGATPGIAFAGWFADRGTRGESGSIEAAVEAARNGRVDRLLLALSPEEVAMLPDLTTACVAAPVELEWLPEIPGGGRLRIDETEGWPVVLLGEFPLLGWNGVVKRTVDILFSAAGLVLLAPLGVLIALVVRLSSPGPVFYRQERIGRDGRRFQMVKFRSMRLDAEPDGPRVTSRNDPRTTAAGRFLRRTSLDELPQLWNVLRGEMSLVGPRPERPALVGDLARVIPAYPGRHRVKSGMTGWAQVHGLRGADSSMEERVRCDLYYIENWSLALDLRILVRTLAGLFRQRNAY